MRFRFIGPEPAEVFGYKWTLGVVHDVLEEHAIGKLSNHAHFERADGTPPPAMASAEVVPMKKPRKARG